MPSPDNFMAPSSVLVDQKARSRFQFLLDTEYPKAKQALQKQIAAATDPLTQKRLQGELTALDRKWGQSTSAAVNKRNVDQRLAELREVYSGFRSMEVAPVMSPAIVEHYHSHIKKEWGAKDATGRKAIVWRSDSRSPRELFGTGFAARDYTLMLSKGGLQAPLFRPTSHELDIDPGSGVCLAVDIRGTCFFPLDVTITRPYVYACYLAEGYNTYYVQKEYAAQTGDMGKIWKYKERVACVVHPHDMLAAVQMERRFTTPNAATITDIQGGVEFKLDRQLITNVRALIHHEKDEARLTAMLDSARRTISQYSNWSGPYTYNLSAAEKDAYRAKLADQGFNPR